MYEFFMITHVYSLTGIIVFAPVDEGLANVSIKRQLTII